MNDAVIIGHSQLKKIPISPEREKRMIEKQIEEITEGIQSLDKRGDTRFTVKQLESTKKNLQTRLKKLADIAKRDDVVTFEELGVDRLFIDEAHEFKNLFLYTKMRNVAGIGQTNAEKSTDLYNNKFGCSETPEQPFFLQYFPERRSLHIAKELDKGLSAVAG